MSHKHKWEWGMSGAIYCRGCNTGLAYDDVLGRLNAAEELTAKFARELADVLAFRALPRTSEGACALRAYANKLEE